MNYFKAILILAICIVSVKSFSQTNSTASIKGRVTDSTGTAIPYSNISIEGLNLGTSADDNGYYHLKNVPSGTHRLTAQFIGFKPISVTVVVKDSATIVRNFKLIEETVEVEEIVVERREKTATQQLKESGFNVNAIETEKFKNTTADMNQILNKSTGVKVREQGGVGSDFNFAINGLSGRSVRFFVDGVPMDLMGSTMSLNNIPVNLAERIEVYKGVLPVTLGADALGGAVNLITNQKLARYLDASYSIGSFNTHRVAVTGQYAHDSTGIIIRGSGFYNFSDNNYIMRDMDVWNAEQYAYVKKDLRRFHDHYRSALGQVEVGVKNKKWADVFFIGGSLSAFKQDIQTGINQNAAYGKADRVGDAYSTSLRYRKDSFILKGLQFNLFASNSRDKYVVYDTTNLRYFWDQTSVLTNVAEMGGKKMVTHVIRPRNFVRANFSYQLGQHHSLGLNYTLDNIKNSNYDELIIDKDYNPGVITKHIIGLAYQQQFFRKKITNTFFAKYYGLALQQPQLIATTGETYSARDWFSNYGYGVASRYMIYRSSGIKVSYEKAYRLPEVGEMFGNGFNQIANLNLKPENSDNYNVGLFSSLRFEKHALYFEASGFYRNAKDFIHSVVYLSNAQVSRFENTSNVIIKGLETEVRYDYMRWLNVYVNASYQNAINNTKYPFGVSSGTIEATYLNKIPNQPWLFANSGIGVSRGGIFNAGDKVYLNWDFQYTHWFYLTWEAYGSPDSKSKIPTQRIQNVSISYSIRNGKYNVSAECRNLTDALAYDNFRLQKPGRAFSLKLRVFIDKF